MHLTSLDFRLYFALVPSYSYQADCTFIVIHVLCVFNHSKHIGVHYLDGKTIDSTYTIDNRERNECVFYSITWNYMIENFLTLLMSFEIDKLN